jgi:hypothetical protein
LIGSAEAVQQRNSPYKKAIRGNLSEDMGRVLKEKSVGVNQIGIVACRLAWGLPVSLSMTKASPLIRWFGSILCSFLVSSVGLAQASPPAVVVSEEKTLDQKIDEWFGKATGPFVNAVFYPFAADIDVEKVSKMPENLTLAAPGGADLWYYRADEKSEWQRVSVAKNKDGLYCEQLGMN